MAEEKSLSGLIRYLRVGVNCGACSYNTNLYRVSSLQPVDISIGLVHMNGIYYEQEAAVYDIGSRREKCHYTTVSASYTVVTQKYS